MSGTSHRADARTEQETTGARAPAASDGLATVERYETEEGVVFYDAEHPLAWIQAETSCLLVESR